MFTTDARKLKKRKWVLKNHFLFDDSSYKEPNQPSNNLCGLNDIQN